MILNHVEYLWEWSHWEKDRFTREWWKVGQQFIENSEGLFSQQGKLPQYNKCYRRHKSTRLE